MSKVRVFELAKDLNMPSKDLVDLLNELGVRAKNHMSAIDQNAANYVVRKYGPKTGNEEVKEVAETKSGDSKENKAEQIEQQEIKVEVKPKRNESPLTAVKTATPASQVAPRPNQPAQPKDQRGHQGSKTFVHQNPGTNRPADSKHGQYLGTATYRNQNPRPQGAQQGNFRHSGDARTPNQNRPAGVPLGTATYRNPRPNQGQGSYQQGGQQRPGNFQGQTDRGPRPQGAKRPFGSSEQHGARPQQPKKSFEFQVPPPPPQVTQNAPAKAKDWGTSNNRSRKRTDFDEMDTRHSTEKRGAEKKGKKKAPTSNPLGNVKHLANRITSSDELYDDELLASRKRREKKQKIKRIEFDGNITVRDLAVKLEISSSDAVKKLVSMGVMANINQELEADVAQLLASEFGVEAELTKDRQEREVTVIEEDDAPEMLVTRPPVVTIMGHVDHGKTSLLDAIRKTNVTATEAGGITQHIGAYQVEINGRKITFLDTPGHEAFTSMRARGAQATDVAVLVVAADDGVMPQTIEAINHARAAKVPIVVAINKIDRPGANPEKVKRELMEHDLIAEEWGGDAIMGEVSAKAGTGLQELLELILIVADMSDLKANPNRAASGVVIESKMDKGRGPVATILINKGTLKVGDTFIAGEVSGKVRAMVDYLGNSLEEAGPSTPVEVLGLNEVPAAGGSFNVVSDEREARQLAERRFTLRKQQANASNKKVSLDDLFTMIKEGNVKDLNIIIKADVHGSAEAIKQSLEKLSTPEVRVNVIHCGVGSVVESDIMLASASNAIIIGFNIRPGVEAQKSAEAENVDVRLYRVIYEAIEDVKKAMVGLLDPEYKEVVYGQAEVRQTFKVPKAGVVAGSYVTNGKVTRAAKVRVVRDGIIVHEGKLLSLRRFKDDVKDVQEGYECGIGIDGWNDVKEGDVIEFFGKEEIKREL